MRKKLNALTGFHVIGIFSGTVIRLMPSKGRSGAASSQFWARMAIRSMVSKKLEREIMLCLGNADCAGTTGREPHRATPETPILGPTHRAPKIEVLRLANMIRVHAKTAIVHKLGGAHENIRNNFLHVIGRSVIDAVPLRNSPALLILGTITCTRQPVSPSNICGRTGEATELKPASFCRARLDTQLPSGPIISGCTLDSPSETSSSSNRQGIAD